MCVRRLIKDFDSDLAQVCKVIRSANRGAAGCSLDYIDKCLEVVNGKKTAPHMLSAALITGRNRGLLAQVRGCFKLSDPSKKKVKAEKKTAAPKLKKSECAPKKMNYNRLAKR